MLRCVLVLLSFLWLSNIPLHGQPTCCVSIHPSVDIWAVSALSMMTVLLRAYARRLLSARGWPVGSCGDSLFNGGRSCQTVRSHFSVSRLPGAVRGFQIPTSRQRLLHPSVSWPSWWL